MTGGTYYRTYTNAGSGPTGEADPATVSSFRLDKYLVTVGRFRQFVSGVERRSWLDAARGLGQAHAPERRPGAREQRQRRGRTRRAGSRRTDSRRRRPTNANLAVRSPATRRGRTSAGSQENLPINCVNWYEAYAFCIWDGGFLPSEAEWEYAAAGGSQQREYPWGTTAPGTACPGTGCEYAIYDCDYPSGSGSCTGVTNIAPVGTATLGAGLWGQLDLAGNVWEWNLDWYATLRRSVHGLCLSRLPPPTGCSGAATSYDAASNLLPPYRNDNTPTDRNYDIGFRCARTP